MGEVVAFAQVLTQTGMLKTIQEQVRFARARGWLNTTSSILSPCWSALCFLVSQPYSPFTNNSLHLLSVHGAFGPKAAASSLYPLPLSRGIQVIRTVAALRTHFREEVLARMPFPTPFGLIDRTGRQWVVSDVDGTRATARQRALPQTDTLPTPHRRFETVCAPGYTGRKRGEVVRTRTVMLQAHTHQLLGTFGNAGNGDYRGELKLALGVIRRYATQHGLAPASLLVRLDGLCGDAAPLHDVLTAHLSVIVRSRAYHLLDREVVQKRLAHPPEQVSTHARSVA